MVILNEGNEPTFVTSARREVLDITFVSNRLYPRVIKWEVSEEECGSDHRILIFDIRKLSMEEIKYRNPKSTDWEFYRKMLGSKWKIN